MKDKLLKLFFEDVSASFCIREIARKIKISPMTARKRLNEFWRMGLLKKKEKRLMIEYGANTNNKLFKFELINYFVNKLFTSGVISYLKKKLLYPQVIYLFGSIVKATVIKNSDIDLFILTENKIDIDLKKYEKLLHREINIILMNNKDFLNYRKNNPELLNNIINGIKLMGYLEVF